MGYLQAQEMAEMLEIENAIAWHLSSNHYPPIPAKMVEPCLEAIQAAIEDDWDKEIAMPEGVLYKYGNTAPAWAVVEQHHLHAWVQLDEEYDDE